MVEETHKERVPLPRLFLINLVLLLILGVGFSAWTLAFTDWFPAIGGILALGGLFSWLAFVSKMLSKDASEQLQEKFVTVLGKRRLFAFLIILLIAFVAAASLVGAIRIEVQSTAQIRGFDLYREGSSEPEHRILTSAGSSNIPILTWWGSSQWRVKIPGYPYQPVTVSSFGRPVLYLPQSFRRAVVLIAPSREILGKSERTLKLTVDAGDGHVLTINPYKWSIFWVGCSADVQVPTLEQARLRSDLAEKYSSLQPSVTTPFSDPKWLPQKEQGSQARQEFEMEFLPGKKLHITAYDLTRGANPKVPVIDKEIDLKESAQADFVQLEYLRNEYWKMQK